MIHRKEVKFTSSNYFISGANVRFLKNHVVIFFNFRHLVNYKLNYTPYIRIFECGCVVSGIIIFLVITIYIYGATDLYSAYIKRISQTSIPSDAILLMHSK